MKRGMIDYNNYYFYEYIPSKLKNLKLIIKNNNINSMAKLLNIIEFFTDILFNINIELIN